METHTQQSTTGTTIVKMRYNLLSLSRPAVKKKKLEYTEEHTSQADDDDDYAKTVKKIVTETALESKDPLRLTQSTSYIPLPTIVSVTEDDIKNNAELANDLKAIEVLKQKHFRHRIASGRMVKESKLLRMSNFEGFDILKNETNSVVLQSEFGGFHRPTYIKPEVKPNGDSLEDIREEIKIWRRGLSDAVEYLSCLKYPPTDTAEIISHFDIKRRWLSQSGSISGQSSSGNSQEL